MNETTYQLQAEHARYRTALERISKIHGIAAPARRAAQEALNLPQPPVTLDDIRAALLSKNGDYCHPSIEIFSDGSATINFPRGCESFTTVREALDYINKTEAE